MSENEPPPPPNAMFVREAAAKWVPQGPVQEEWVTAAEFKAQCLRLIEEVRQGRGEVVVTRYGKPVARLVPYTPEEPVSIFGHLQGTVLSHGDLIAPIDEPWDAAGDGDEHA